MADNYKLTYFKARGIGETIRLLFKVAEVPFEDIRLDEEGILRLADGRDSKFEYLKSSLPILHVGDQAMQKSGVWGNEISLCRYLARKFDLIGASEFDAVNCDKVVEDLFALRSAVIILVFQKTHDTDNSAVHMARFQTQLMPVFLGNLENKLEQNGGGWLVGTRLTWADVVAAYTLEFIGNLLGEDEVQKALEKFPKLATHYAAVYAVPQISAWVAERPAVEGEVEHMLQFLM